MTFASPLADIALKQPTNRICILRFSQKTQESFFRFTGGPPQTSHELNGWGDNIVHEYLRGIERRGRPGRSRQQQGLRLRMGRDWRHKRFLREDNTNSLSTSWLTP